MVRSQLATRFALGFAALALTVTGLMSPATQASAAPMFKPDIQVSFMYEHPMTSEYVFKLKNTGSVASGPIAIKELCAYITNDGTKRPVTGGHVLPSLGAGKQTETSIECPLSSQGASAFGARLEAGTQDDIDTSNNHAESTYYSKY